MEPATAGHHRSVEQLGHDRGARREDDAAHARSLMRAAARLDELADLTGNLMTRVIASYAQWEAERLLVWEAWAAAA